MSVVRRLLLVATLLGGSAVTLAGPALAANGFVAISNSSYTPANYNDGIYTGDKVTWHNYDGIDHTVTFDSGGSSGNLSHNERFTHQFLATGTFAYHCSIHPGMRGSITVRKQPGPPVNTFITAGPSGDTTARSASFSFRGTASGDKFRCRLDGGAFAACTSPKSYSGLSLGTHTFAVQATSADGETDPTPATRTWRIVAAPSRPPSSAAPTTGGGGGVPTPAATQPATESASASASPSPTEVSTTPDDATSSESPQSELGVASSDDSGFSGLVWLLAAGGAVALGLLGIYGLRKPLNDVGPPPGRHAAGPVAPGVGWPGAQPPPTQEGPTSGLGWPPGPPMPPMPPGPPGP